MSVKMSFSSLLSSSPSTNNNTNNNTTADDDTDSTPPPAYPYSDYVKTPKEMGMGTKGNLHTLGKDIKGLKSYIALLIDGKSHASKAPHGKPLGNKFFLKTGKTCTDEKTGELQDQYA